MNEYPFEKKPAFFPFVSAELFFEAEDVDNVVDLGAFDAELEAELDEILATS